MRGLTPPAGPQLQEVRQEHQEANQERRRHQPRCVRPTALSCIDVRSSVRWFKEVEMKKGAGMKSGNFEEWFHGVITRKDAEVSLHVQLP